MIEFIRRNRVLLSSSFFLVCSLVLLSVNARHPGRIDPLGRAFLEVMAPFQRVTSQGVARMARLWRGYVGLVAVERDNAKLRARLHDLERHANEQRELELMNHRLKRLLALQRRLPAHAVSAEVTGRDASAWFQSLTLNKGEVDGIAPGMPVLAPEGVVGIISKTSPHASRVLLLTDPNSGVDVLVQRTRVRGIVSGLLEKGAILKYVKRADDLQVGDRVVTSGLDGIFPKGVSVGRITRVSRKDRGLFLYAEVTPSADAAKLEEVVVTEANGAELLDTRPVPPPVVDLVGPPEPEIYGPSVPPVSAPAPHGATAAPHAPAVARHARQRSPVPAPAPPASAPLDEEDPR
jgi:rod shape-determining protein MreC